MQKEQERAFGSNPNGADSYGDKTGYNKTERTGDNDGPGSHPNREKNQLKYRYDARLFTLWINNTSTGILIGCWGRAFLILMIDDASIMHKVTPVFSRQTYLEWSETSATMEGCACARFKQLREDLVLLEQNAHVD